MLTDQVLITLIQTLGGVALAGFGYLKILAAQRKNLEAIQDTHAETASKIQENTDKTVEIGVAVNGRVEMLVQEKVDAIELAYQTKIEALEARVLLLQGALDAATAVPEKSIKP